MSLFVMRITHIFKTFTGDKLFSTFHIALFILIFNYKIDAF